MYRKGGVLYYYICAHAPETTCASIAHHVVGNAVAEDEDLPVTDDFAGGLVLLLSLGDCCFLGDL